MCALHECLRVLAAVGLLLGITVAPVALARKPVLPNIEAQSDDGGRTARAQRMASADVGPRADGRITIGPSSAQRMYGGSVLSDLLAP